MGHFLWLMEGPQSAAEKSDQMRSERTVQGTSETGTEILGRLRTLWTRRWLEHMTNGAVTQVTICRLFICRPSQAFKRARKQPTNTRPSDIIVLYQLSWVIGCTKSRAWVNRSKLRGKSTLKELLEEDFFLAQCTVYIIVLQIPCASANCL